MGLSFSRSAYHLVICDEAHTALGEKTSAAIRAFSEPLYIGMTATEQLIAKQVSDVFPASVDDLPLGDAARRGLIAPLRCLRVPPAAAINSVPIVGGDFEERALAAALDHPALNQAAASLYRERFGATPGIVYAAGVEHAYNLAQEFRAAGLKAEAVSGRTPPARPRRDTGRLRARRDQRPHQRPAPRGRLELTARDRLHAPRSDRVAARLPAAHRPDHAHPSPERSRRGRRFRPQGRNPLRARYLAARPARLRLLPRGRARHARTAPAPARGRAASSLRCRGSCRSPPTSPVDSTSSSASGSGSIPVPRRRGAALLGHDRGTPDPLRPARGVREEVRRGQSRQGRPRAVPLNVRCGVPESASPHDRADGSGRDADRPRRLRRPRDARDPGTALGEGSLRGCPRPPPRDRRGEAARAGADTGPLDVATRASDAQGEYPQGLDRVPGGEAPARRGRQLSGLPPRGERQAARPRGGRDAASRRRRVARVGGRLHTVARTPRSTMRARSSARSTRSRTRSRTTSRRGSRPPASPGGVGASAREERRPRRSRRRAASRARTSPFP